ncbi:TPA: IS30 family transposase [Candidatus Poribacteria bacterium]|nr:IS30 family transposase [Candidatus Poribacteria bacterium]
MVLHISFFLRFDNGREFCMHQTLADTLGAKIYFATPYHSWERGLNENTNGLVRQYFPKQTPFDNISHDELRSVVEKINHRPRKCLGYKTPFEVLSAACQRKGVALRV